ncbi:TMEM165/GDT1 family protein [Sphingomonas sp. GlSt437]|uniref:TMEM165/GDT1 family protein n=1 Tax=Sphingomonas sp. GlSt437 TaxID=3389970 RepID=UPI003A8A68C5
MNALMAALVAALIIQASDRTPWLAARLATPARPGAVIAAVILSAILAQAVAAVAGSLLAPILTPNARQLFVGLALLSAAFGTFLPIKPISGEPRGFADSFIILTAAAMGDRTQFATLAIAAQNDLPVFAALGAAIGVVVVQVAVVLADARPSPSLLRLWRALAGSVLALAGAWLALAGLRLL